MATAAKRDDLRGVELTRGKLRPGSMRLVSETGIRCPLPRYDA